MSTCRVRHKPGSMAQMSCPVHNEFRAKYVNEMSVFERESLAFDPGTAPQMLTALGQSRESHIVTGLLINPSTPPELLVEYALGDEWRHRSMVAASPACPSQVAAYLLGDPNPEVVESTRRKIYIHMIPDGRWEEPLFSPTNRDAWNAIVSRERWWELMPDDEEVVLLRAIYPDA